MENRVIYKNGRSPVVGYSQQVISDSELVIALDAFAGRHTFQLLKSRKCMLYDNKYQLGSIDKLENQ